MTNGSILVPCWMVGQEFGCCYVDLFSSDNFLAIVKAEASGHEDLATICEAVCQNMVDDNEFIKATLLPKIGQPFVGGCLDGSRTGFQNLQVLWASPGIETSLGGNHIQRCPAHFQVRRKESVRTSSV